AALVGPPLALGVALVALGCAPDALTAIAQAGGGVVAGGAVHASLAYELASAKTACAVAAWAAGALVALTARAWRPALARAQRAVSAALDPARLARAGLWLSDRLHRAEVRGLRDRVGAIVAPTAVLVLLAFVVSG